MTESALRLLLVSDFNLDTLARMLKHDEELALDAETGGPQPVVPFLLGDDAGIWQPQPDAVLVWTLPQGVIPAFGDVLRFEGVRYDEITDQVNAFATAIRQAAGRARFVFVPTWVLPTYQQGHGILDMRPDLGLAHTIARMNLDLASLLADVPNVYLLDAGRWIETAGRHAFSPTSWYLAKIPFGNDVLKAATSTIKSALESLGGRARKLLVVDLDDTIWGGPVGDLGWEQIRLGGHDAVGEAYVDFQRELRALKNRGVLLGIVSKNEESVALQALREHPEMVLRPDDFVAWRINWGDKAANLLDLVDELNLGLQSVVFVDDSAVERARVHQELPEVLVPEWPDDCTRFRPALLALRVFDTPERTDEDAVRTELYRAERERTEHRRRVSSLDEWLATLEMRVEATRLAPADLSRATQLLNKTNQMNLRTRRLGETELKAWVEQTGHEMITFRVFDRFGASGLTGLLGLETDGSQTVISDFVLSCRVMGRRVEETMLHVASVRSRENGTSTLLAEYRPTARNAPCLAFWRRSGFDEASENVFRRNIELAPYPLPDVIELARKEPPSRV